MVVGVLSIELFVLKKTDFIVYESSSHAMRRADHPKGNVGRDNHGGRSVGVAQHLQGVAAVNVQLSF